MSHLVSKFLSPVLPSLLAICLCAQMIILADTNANLSGVDNIINTKTPSASDTGMFMFRQA